MFVTIRVRRKQDNITKLEEANARIAALEAGGASATGSSSASAAGLSLPADAAKIRQQVQTYKQMPLVKWMALHSRTPSLIWRQKCSSWRGSLPTRRRRALHKRCARAD